MGLRKDAIIAVLLPGGPHHGPYTAQGYPVLEQILKKNGYDIAGIFAISGPSPTALLGCIGETDKLIGLWRNLTPQDIVGPRLLPRAWLKGATLRESILSNHYLRELLSRNIDLDKVFAPEAIPIKIAAIDYLTATPVIFSNKIPEHKNCMIDGVLGSMGLVPWFDSPIIKDPKGLKLLDHPHVDNEAMLVDGAYGGDLLLNEIVRDPIGYNTIFIFDINNFHASKTNARKNDSWKDKLFRTTHLTINSRDRLAMRSIEAINEMLDIRDMLVEAQDISDIPQDLEPIIRRLDSGYLRLGKKHKTNIYVISNPKEDIPFNFAQFKKSDVLHLRKAGHNAVITTMRKLKLDTKGFRLNKLNFHP